MKPTSYAAAERLPAGASGSRLDRGSIQFVRHFLNVYPGRTAAMVALLILAGLAEGVGLIALLPLLDQFLGGDRPDSVLGQTIAGALAAVGLQPTLGTLVALIVAAIVAKALLLWAAMKQVGYTVARVANELRLRLIRALTHAEWNYFTGQPVGHFTTALGGEAQRASRAYMDACLGLAGAIQAMIYFAVVWVLSWRAALLALLFGSLIVFALRGLIAMSREAGQQQTRIMRSLVARLSEILLGVKAVKAMAREDDVWPFIERETVRFQQAQQRAILARESLRAFHEPIAVAIVATGLFLAVSYASIALSVLLVLTVVFYRLLTKASELQGQYQSMVANENAFWTLLDHIERAEQARERRRERPGGAAPSGLRDAVRFDAVTLGYGAHEVLSDVSLTLPAGKLVAFVGASGSGKTTLIDALTGNVPVRRGRVWIDDLALSDLDLTAWRRRIGYVPQENLLFHDSIRRNVTLGGRQFDDAQVVAALRAAGAWDFVERLPERLDHVVGERGGKLSGGQRQRIAIARALVGQPDLLILDEATAALDPQTEAEICAALTALRPRVTILAVTHQPALQRAADLVFEVAGGAVTLTTDDAAAAAL